MPEYLAPAVYVEETSFRSKSIEGVSTSGVRAGPLRKGPTEPELVTSFAEFARIFGGLDDLAFVRVAHQTGPIAT